MENNCSDNIARIDIAFLIIVQSICVRKGNDGNVYIASIHVSLRRTLLGFSETAY